MNHKKWSSGGEARRGIQTPEWRVWHSMIARCTIPTVKRFADYGGRGITVHPSWMPENNGYLAFLAHVGRRPGPQHSLDRVDNDGNYEPGNVRWATRSEQCRNTRATRKIAAFGRTLCVSEWALITGLAHNLITRRIDERGWSVERALSTPPRPQPCRHCGKDTGRPFRAPKEWADA